MATNSYIARKTKVKQHYLLFNFLLFGLKKFLFEKFFSNWLKSLLK